MSQDAHFPTIKGDLTITQIGEDGEGGFELSRTHRGDAVLVTTVPDRASYGVDEAAGHVRLLALSCCRFRGHRD